MEILKGFVYNAIIREGNKNISQRILIVLYYSHWAEVFYSSSKLLNQQYVPTYHDMGDTRNQFYLDLSSMLYHQELIKQHNKQHVWALATHEDFALWKANVQVTKLILISSANIKRTTFSWAE